MIIVAPFKHHRARFKRAGVFRVGQIAGAEFLGNHAGLHDAEIEQIARQHEEARLFLQRLGKGADHLAVAGRARAYILRHCPARHAQAIAIQHALLQQFPHHRRHAARAVEALAKETARRLHIDDQRQVIAMLHPVGGGDFHACMACHGDDMGLGVARPADSRNHADGVQKALARQDLGRAQVLIGHLHNPAAGFISNLAALAIGRGDRRASGQRQAKRFGHGIHGRGRAHRIAMARRRSRIAGALKELFLVDLARRQLAAAAPDHRARPHQIAFMPPVEHRPARQDNGGNIHRAGRHHLAGGGLVAARGQHHRVDGIAIKDLHQPQIGQIAIQRGGGAAAVFKDRMNRKFHADPTRIADAVTHALGQIEVDAVAGRKVAAALCNTDDRAAGAQFVGRDPVIHEAFQIERYHVRPRRIGKPVLRTETAGGIIGHLYLSLRAALERFYHEPKGPNP